MDFPDEKIKGYTEPIKSESVDFKKGFNDAHQITWQTLNALDPNDEQAISRSLKAMIRSTMYPE